MNEKIYPIDATLSDVAEKNARYFTQWTLSGQNISCR